jgi:hypothetical protein
MIRKIIAISLFVSFLAMVSSGLLMMFIGKTSFTLQMHPVHKTFGLIMTISMLGHLILNGKQIYHYIKIKPVFIWLTLLLVILIFMYSIVINSTIPNELADQINQLSNQIESIK